MSASRSIQPKAAAPGSRPRELTGRMVLAYLLSFFAVVFAVNFYMAHVAIATFTGVQTESSYEAGLAFEAQEEAARAQDARHWKVEGHLARSAAGEVTLQLAVADKNGVAPAHLTAAVRLVHPTQAEFDQAMTLAQVAPGHFVGTGDARAGQWDLVLELNQGAERVFRSKNRVILH